MGHSLCSFILRQIPRRSPTHNAVYFTTTRLGGYTYLDAPKVKIIKNRKKRIQQLYELNISPVTIEARSKIDVLPSIQALLLLP